MSQSAAASSASKPKHWQRVLRWLLAPACFVILAWMVMRVGPGQLLSTLCSMPYTIAACVAVWGVGYLLNAASFRQVIGGVGCDTCPSYGRVLHLTVTGYAINYVTPFGLLGGEPWRILRLKPYCGTERATQSVVLYSMMHIASHFCFWLLSLLVAVAVVGHVGETGAETGLPLWAFCLLALCLLALLWLFWRLYRRGIALRFMRRWVDWPLLNPSVLPPDRFLRALGLELLSRLVNVVEYWLIMQSLGYESFGYAESLLVVAFSSLLANVLFFSPLQMGTREGGIYLALQYLMTGDLLPVAVTLSFATRIREFVWIAIGLAGLGLKRSNGEK